MDVAIEIINVEGGNNEADPASVEEKESYPNFWQNLKQYVWEYCSRTSIHGIGYLGERRRTIPERIWWIVSIQIALYLCISYTMKTYHKWTTSPVVVTFANTQTPIWEIPFPAVTICPEVKSIRKHLNFTDVFVKKNNNITLTETEEVAYQQMLLLCYNKHAKFEDNLRIINESIFDFLIKAASSPTIQLNLWGGSKDLYNFSPVLTNEGICYTFNGLDKSELFTDVVWVIKSVHNGLYTTKGRRSSWSSESGYSDTATKLYPDRIYTSGADGGLSLFLFVNENDVDYACGDSLQGFKVMLHNPEEVPSYIDKYFRVSLYSMVEVAVKPNMMAASDDLKNYSPTERQCYFSKDRPLKYFRIYSQENCINECLIDFTLKICGCVGFYMPRKNSTPICDARKHWGCVMPIQVRNTNNSIGIHLKLSKDAPNLTKNRCDCLPSCTSLGFEYELSQAQWNPEEYLKIVFPNLHHIKQRPGHHWYLSYLKLSFKDMQFVKSERNELYGQAEFWANCGGLMGLFTGFSFISGLEILYYLTLRLACNLRKFGTRYWSGTEEILETRRRSDKKRSS